MAIFNRSYYEEVLVVRVHELVPKTVWSRRYDQINAFEKILAENGTTILKFMLHISKQEQAERHLRADQDLAGAESAAQQRAFAGALLEGGHDVGARAAHRQLLVLCTGAHHQDGQ